MSKAHPLLPPRLSRPTWLVTVNTQVSRLLSPHLLRVKGSSVKTSTGDRRASSLLLDYAQSHVTHLASPRAPRMQLPIHRSPARPPIALPGSTGLLGLPNSP